MAVTNDVPIDAATPAFRLGMRGKSIVFLTTIFVVVGIATYWALVVIGNRVSGQLGAFTAERYVLWYNER
ncbi:MAG: hypothetical protein QGF53_11405, partial [Alphaproteobacteria bacterium]|nr:hypothetical protein [Alphaproteobacteria bacterium]